MADIEFGMYTPFYPLDHIVEVVRTTAKYPFDSVWVGDHLAGFPSPHAYDAWSELVYFAMINKRLKLGMSVSDPHKRHPAAMAQTITTIDALSNGRIIPGFGPGEAMNLDPYGIDWDRPVRKLKEYVTVMKKLWTGSPVDYEGDFYKMSQAVLLPRPVQRPGPPIWIAANAPKALEMTGEVGDGWIPLAESPETYRRNLAIVREHSRKAGRPSNAVVPALFLYSSVAMDAEEARTTGAPIARIALVWFAEKLRQFGYKMSFGDLEFTKATITSAGMKRTMDVSREVPAEVIDRVCAFGSPDDCIEKIERFIKAGARHIVIVPLVPNEKRMENVRLFGKVARYFKDQKG